MTEKPQREESRSGYWVINSFHTFVPIANANPFGWVNHWHSDSTIRTEKIMTIGLTTYNFYVQIVILKVKHFAVETKTNASVAQLARATTSKLGGCGFESHPTHHFSDTKLIWKTQIHRFQIHRLVKSIRLSGSIRSFAKIWEWAQVRLQVKPVTHI
mgnify:CR=1 FL=1